MQITEEMMKEFSLKFDEDHPLSALTPTELPRNGAEQFANGAINLDPPGDSDLATGISLIHQDDNDPNRPWAIDPARQRTFVLVQGGNGPEMEVIYRFDGLLMPADARLWFRDKLGFPSTEEQFPPALPAEQPEA